MKVLAEYAKYITAIAAAIGVAYSGIQFQSNYVTDKAKEVVAPVEKKLNHVEYRLSMSELQTLLQHALEDLYYWRDLSRKYPDDQEIKDKLAEAEQNVEDIKERIRRLEEEESESEQEN